ncbi:MAG TPA: carboxy terminal-processing peptidase [Methylomirabilota bacterium]|nr:carboxy terminal-processing peptidase [Methylomirabilota bacterium]
MKSIPCLLLLFLVGQPIAAATLTTNQAGRVSLVVGSILEHRHYRQAAIDDDLSRLFLDNYLDALDYNRMFFLQSDVDEFREDWAEKLDDAVLDADATPAFVIFERFMTRLRERTALIPRLLEEDYDFGKDEKFLAARHEAPWPANEREAEELWRSRVKFELLRDRLARVDSDGSPGNAETSGESNEADYDPKETLERIGNRYKRLLKDYEKHEVVDILQTYLTALSNAFDPHSDYLSPQQAENFKITSVDLKLTGIGAVLTSNLDGYTEIVRLMPGGPAHKSGELKPSDRIIAVGQGDEEPVDVIEEKLGNVVEMIRGPVGTEVRLTVIPGEAGGGGTKKIIRLTRDEIPLEDQYARARIVEESDEQGNPFRLGVITLGQFYVNSAADVEILANRLKKEGIKGLVLDLRHNGGGLLSEAIKLTGLFIEKGPVVQVRDSLERSDILRDDDPAVAYDGPLVVLVDRLSASASEITAAALQDYGRALIVGGKATHGKGTVQTVHPLSQYIRPQTVASPGDLKFTISKFYRVAGGTTQREGVESDIVLPSLYDYAKIGESILPNSLPADSTVPLEYERQNRVKAYLPELREKSHERVRQERDFEYLASDIERLQKNLEEKHVSLNETERRREIQEQEDLRKARQEERKSRAPEDIRVFELTLNMAKEGRNLMTPEQLKAEIGEDALTRPPGAELKLDAESPDEAPVIDFHLGEVLNILRDYVHLLAQAEDTDADEKLVSSPSTK